MVSDIAYEIVTKVRALYRSDASAALVFDWASSRSRDAKETSVDRLVDQLQIAKSEAIRVCKKLQEAGCGRFLYGRRGSKSRIRWFYSPRSLGNAAKGNTSHLDEIGDEYDDHAVADTQTEGLEGRVSKSLGREIEHRFALRSGLTVTLSLPEDLTRKEAERMAKFIHTLPFER